MKYPFFISYVLEAYDVEAFFYLSKPIDEKKLKRVLQKAILKTEKYFQEFIMVSKERQKRIFSMSQKLKGTYQMGMRCANTKNMFIDSFDFCILFGNILDHALEACERVIVKNCFLLEVKNSMDRVEKCEEGLTKKENDKEQGIGLENVGDMVHKYQGVRNRKVEKGIFRISILIPLKDIEQDIKGT